MKSIALLTLVVGLCLTPFFANAQYRQGEVMVNGGISLGLLGYGYGTHSGGFPPLTVNVEYSIDDRLAFGPFIGFFSRTYKSIGYDRVTGARYPTTSGFSSFAFGARGTYHGTSLINELFDISIDEDRFDIYATGLIGYEIYSWDYDQYAMTDNKSGRFILGPVLGGRYHFNEQFSTFLEIGRGTFGFATLGASIRL